MAQQKSLLLFKAGVEIRPKCAPNAADSDAWSSFLNRISSSVQGGVAVIVSYPTSGPPHVVISPLPVFKLHINSCHKLSMRGVLSLERDSIQPQVTSCMRARGVGGRVTIYV